MRGDQEARRRREALLTRLSWGVFILALGIVWLYEATYGRPLRGVVFIVAGGILILLNVERYRERLPVRAFTLGVGLLLMALGAGDYAGFSVPLVPLLLTLVGIFLVGGALLRGRT